MLANIIVDLLAQLHQVGPGREAQLSRVPHPRCAFAAEEVIPLHQLNVRTSAAGSAPTRHLIIVARKLYHRNGLLYR